MLIWAFPNQQHNMMTNLKHIIAASAILITSLTANTYAATRPPLENTPVGFGAAGATGTYGIPVCNLDGTFGAPTGFSIYTCSSLEEINSHKANNTIILVNPGTYGTGKQSTNATNDLEINGLTNFSIIGLGGVTFKKVTIKGTCENVLIRNISVKGFAYDGMPITAGGHIWIDHCTIGDDVTSTNKEKPDGAMDIYSNSNLYLTISWTKIQNHWKTSLHGKDDGDNGSTKRNITHYRNYYYNTHQRTPRIRGGRTHILNCLYENNGFGRTANMTSSEYDMAKSMIYKDDGEYLKNRLVVSDGYAIMATNNSDVVVDSCFFFDVRWPICVSRPCDEFTAKYGDLQSPDICNGCVKSRTANAGNKYCRQTGNGYYDLGLPNQITVKKDTVSCPSGACETMTVPLDYSYIDKYGDTRYVINPGMLNPGKRSIKFDEYLPESAFNPGTIAGYFPAGYSPLTNVEVREVVSAYAGADTYDMHYCTAAEPTLTLTSGSLNQTNVTSISPIVFTWGGGATGVRISGIPDANITINEGAKTATISGTLVTTANYVVTTIGGSGEAVAYVGTLSTDGNTYNVEDYDGTAPVGGCDKMVNITLTVTTAGTYELAVFNGGTKVKSVMTNAFGTGKTSVFFSAEDLDSGEYTYKLLNGASVVDGQTGVITVP